MTRNLSVRQGTARLIGILAAALLPLSGLVFAPPAQAATPIGTLCTITSDGMHTCPPVPAPPSLINIGALGASDPAVATSLKALEEKAVDNTIADHDLSAGDRDAVRSWGRSDAQSELWALIVEAIKTPATIRTTDQKNAVTWMAGLASSQAHESALQSGAEYATWAGLDVRDYQQMASTGSQAQLTAFLGSDVRSFSPLFTPRGGYCRYRPPAPYSTEYDGSATATCFTPCTSPLGCAVPTPTYDQFVKWGQSAATYGTLTDAKFQSQAANIATGVTFGSAVVASAVAGVTVSATMGSVLFGSSLAAALLPNLVVAESLPEAAVAVLGEAAAAEYFGGLAASAIGAAVAVVILAIVIAVMEGIRVTDNAKLPGKIAELVVGARTATTDPATLIDTTAGAASLYGLFVGATLPVPNNSIACDNSLIPPWAYSSSKLPGFLIYVPLGQNDAISSPVDRSGCLNPSDIPAAGSTDPQWQVSKQGTSSAQSSPTITVADNPSNVSQTLRVHGNWFVSQVTVGDRAPRTVQTLRLTYTDWGGTHRTTWLRRTPRGDYRFFTISPDGTANAIDPSTCRSEGTCTNDGEIRYVGTDGAKYTASLRPYAPAVGTPTFSPLQGLEGSAVLFDAAGFHAAGAEGAITYSWRFALCGTRGCEQVVVDKNGFPVIDGDGHVVREPPYSAAVAGSTASHTWQAPGTYKVALTATDANGDSATTGFYVGVAGSPPALQLAADCAVIFDAACDTRTTDLGTQTRLSGVLRHAGTEDNETVQVTWGDGTTPSFQNLGPNLIPFEGAGTSAHLSLITDRIMRINAEHTYTRPGVYYGTVLAQDWGNGTDSETFTVTVRGPQSISFPALTDKHYGDAPFTVAATGGGSGNPVTYAAGPADVCTSGGTDGSRIALVGAGTCTVTASQAGVPPAYLAAPDVTRSFEVDPATLTITAEDATKVYGAPNPAFATSISGLVNADTAADVVGLQVDGPPRDTSVGPHPIVASGATIANYDIRYVDGTLNVTRAPLTITADHQVVAAGTLPTYGWTGSGWVNGDNDATLRTPPNAAPSCSATAGGSPVSATTSPGIYPAAITCRGAADANYDITYAAGGLTINPVLVLDQQGLPSTVPRLAQVDGVAVTLPARTAVTYDTQHTYGFPEVVVASGVTYRTTEPSFSGTVKANRSATATYVTLTQLIAQTAGIDAKQVTPLTAQWTAVQKDLKAGKTSTALRDLHVFADAVRAQTGKKITTAAGATLLAYAQAVYKSQGGTGTV